MVIKNLCILVFVLWMKVALALEGTFQYLTPSIGGFGDYFFLNCGKAKLKNLGKWLWL